MSVARFTVRNIDDETMGKLRARAEMNGRTVAEEFHEILKTEFDQSADDQPSLQQPTSRQKGK